MSYRKAEYEQLRANISITMRKHPELTARTLADRYGVSVTMVANTAKLLGVTLPDNDLLTHAEVSAKMPRGRQKNWGYAGIHIERNANAKTTAGGSTK